MEPMPQTTSLLTVLALAAACLAPAIPARAAERVDVPVHLTMLPNGDPRYSVPVTVGGGPPIEAELDTGSFGLRVLKGALKPQQYQATAQHRSYAFGGGAKFDGVLARAVVGIGPALTAAPVLFHLVESVGCAEGRPGCAAAKIKPEDYRIAGDGIPGQGFEAILGLSLRRAASDDSAQNPLTAAGPRSWILTLPRPGSAEPGHLVIDPDEADRAGFALVKLSPQADLSDRLSGWADAALPGCLVEDGGERFCGRTLLDSGAPGLSVATDTVGGPKPWGAGRKARIEIGGADGPLSVPFTSGADYASRVLLHPRRGPEGSTEISVGSLPYLSYAVLYDAEAGIMGFKPRDPAGP
jgi:hypothetical protein